MGMKLSQITSYEFIMAHEDDILDSVESGKVRILNKTINIISEKILTNSTKIRFGRQQKQKVSALIKNIKDAKHQWLIDHKILRFFITTLNRISGFFHRKTVWMKTNEAIIKIRRKTGKEVDFEEGDDQKCSITQQESLQKEDINSAETALKAIIDECKVFINNLSKQNNMKLELESNYPKDAEFRHLSQEYKHITPKQGTQQQQQQQQFLANLKTAMNTNGSLSKIPNDVHEELKEIVINAASNSVNNNLMSDNLKLIMEKLDTLRTRTPLDEKIKTFKKDIKILKDAIRETIQELVNKYGADTINNLLTKDSEKKFTDINTAMKEADNITIEIPEDRNIK